MENELTQGKTGKTTETPESASEVSEKPESNMPLASGVGQRSTKTAQTLGKMNRWFGVADDSKPTIVEEPTAPEPETTTTSSPAGKSRRELNRGIITSLVLLLIFIPLAGTLAYLYYDASLKVSALERNLKNFEQVNAPGEVSQFITILSEERVQSKSFKNEDGSPVGKFILYVAGRLRWAISYGKLEPLENNQMYVVWLIPKTKPNEAERYVRLVVLRDLKSGGGSVVLRESDFPLNFDIINYAELTVTVEPLDQEPKAPTGPRRFSLDLSQFNP